MTLLLAAARLLLFALWGAAQLVNESGLATRFGDPGDPLSGGELKCTQKKLDPTRLVCAHRTLPCGSVVVLHNPRNHQLAVCEVLDRGPFGATLPNGQWVMKLQKRAPGDWRGIVDLSPAVAEALAFNGREPLELVYQRVAMHLRAGREGTPLHH